MFTGLITDVGTIDRVAESDAGRLLRIRCAYGDLRQGESIAVNGACLTARECGAGWFTAAAVVTTIGRTTIGDWRAGRRVNLERALAASDRFGGHFVQGHVDDVAEVTQVHQRDDARLVDLTMPAALMPLVAPHGSLAVDGVGLTVNEVADPNVVQLALIEFTLRHTTLGALCPGDRVHVEADLIAKHVQRLLAAYALSLPSPI